MHTPTPPREITAPLTSPIDYQRTPTYLWMFPGMVGTQANPLPSRYATVPQVVEICCDTFQRYGRDCDAYRHNKLARKLPQITPMLVAQRTGGRRNVNILADVKKMIVFLSREHCRWVSGPHDPMNRYSFDFIARFIGVDRRGAHWIHHHAQDRVGFDRCFTDLYLLCMQELTHRFAVHFDRPDASIPQRVGGQAA